MGKTILQEGAKAPLRVGGALVDVARQAAGHQPLPRTNIPGLGEFATPARNTYDEGMQTNDPLQRASSAVRNVSMGVLDVAATAGMAQTAQHLLSSPKVLYRGENAANKGGVHWTLDKAEAQKFAGPSGKVLETPFPKNMLSDSSPEVQKVLQEAARKGLPAEEAYKELWKQGHTSISGLDSITGKPNFILKPTQDAVAQTIQRHVTSGQQIIQEMQRPGETFGNIPKLIESVKRNIVDGLTHEGQKDAAALIAKLNPAKFSSLHEFQNAALKAATQVLSSPATDALMSAGMQGVAHQAKGGTNK